MNLNHVTVLATDIPRSIAFYRSLGLTLIVESPHYARFECPSGDATFSVHVADSVASESNATVYFESSRLDEWVAELTNAGVAIDSPPADQTWEWREARLRDPDGNRLCLFAAGDTRRNPSWRVGGQLPAPTEYIAFMHGNATSSPSGDQWAEFFARAHASGMFQGGSAVGARHTVGPDGVPDTTAHVVGYMRFDTADREALDRLLEHHPVVKNGGTVEVCELPRT